MDSRTIGEGEIVARRDECVHGILLDQQCGHCSEAPRATWTITDHVIALTRRVYALEQEVKALKETALRVSLDPDDEELK